MRILRQETQTRRHDSRHQVWDINLYRIQGSSGLSGTVICGDCGTLVYQIVYSYLDRDKLKYPMIFNMYLDLKASMENGYRVIQNIAKLPRESQQVLQHLIAACKLSQ